MYRVPVTQAAGTGGYCLAFGGGGCQGEDGEEPVRDEEEIWQVAWQPSSPTTEQLPSPPSSSPLPPGSTELLLAPPRILLEGTDKAQSYWGGCQEGLDCIVGDLDTGGPRWV